MAGARSKPRRRLGRQRKRAPTSAQLLKLLAHPLRRRIVRSIHEAGEARSSSELALELDGVLTNVSYHVRVLRDAGALVLTDALPVRGSTESFYASAVEGDRWLRMFLDATRQKDGDG
jgi:DNA-binding transcriptional ArsR family regulator